MALAAFCAMEPVAYLVHRYVMHGPGLVLHRSHHRRRQAGWQANDAFPAAFALLVLGVMALGYQVRGLGLLVPIGVGVSVYGVVYALVHDGYIHRRVRLPGGRTRPLARLAEAHQVHHRHGGEPFGMLVPIMRSAPQRVAPVPGAGRVGGPEAGEELLAVPALGAGAAHDLGVVALAVGEGLERDRR